MSSGRASRHPRAENRSCADDGQRGSVTIVAAGLLVLSLALSLGVADLARVLVASARAQNAADSAALAAAQELALSGARDPADVATEYAARNGASLVNCSCHEDGFEATVEARVPIGSLLLFADDRSVTSSARAEVNLGEGFRPKMTPSAESRSLDDPRPHPKVGPSRIRASSSATCASVSSIDAASAFSRTCTGLRLPASVAVTPG